MVHWSSNDDLRGNDHKCRNPRIINRPLDPMHIPSSPSRTLCRWDLGASTLQRQSIRLVYGGVVGGRDYVFPIPFSDAARVSSRALSFRSWFDSTSFMYHLSCDGSGDTCCALPGLLSSHRNPSQEWSMDASPSVTLSSSTQQKNPNYFQSKASRSGVLLGDGIFQQCTPDPKALSMDWETREGCLHFRTIH